MAKLIDNRRVKKGRRPWIRIDACTVACNKNAAPYPVKIEGFNLRPGISPPIVTVGGQPLRELEFALDGRSIKGVLTDVPKGTRCIIDYGIAVAELD